MSAPGVGIVRLKQGSGCQGYRATAHLVTDAAAARDRLRERYEAIRGAWNMCVPP